MAGNITPIFSASGDVSSNGSTGMNPTLTTAAADYTGASTNNKVVYTAGANGGFIQRLRFKAIGTNIASVARIYINNGSTNITVTNNSFYGEIALPATTAIATASTIDLDYPMNFAINASFTIYVGLGTTVAAGWTVMAIAGKY